MAKVKHLKNFFPMSYERLCIFSDGTDTYISILGMGLIQLLILLLLIHLYFKISYGKSMLSIYILAYKLILLKIVKFYHLRHL